MKMMGINLFWWVFLIANIVYTVIVFMDIISYSPYIIISFLISVFGSFSFVVLCFKYSYDKDSVEVSIRDINDFIKNYNLELKVYEKFDEESFLRIKSEYDNKFIEVKKHIIYCETLIENKQEKALMVILENLLVQLKEIKESLTKKYDSFVQEHQVFISEYKEYLLEFGNNLKYTSIDNELYIFTKIKSNLLPIFFAETFNNNKEILLNKSSFKLKDIVINYQKITIKNNYFLDNTYVNTLVEHKVDYSKICIFYKTNSLLIYSFKESSFIQNNINHFKEELELISSKLFKVFCDLTKELDIKELRANEEDIKLLLENLKEGGIKNVKI